MKKLIEATIRLDASELLKHINFHSADRYTLMVQKYGEACTKTTAARVISCSTQTINKMLKDGRILYACAGKRVDVRSLAEYIESQGENKRSEKQKKNSRNPMFTGNFAATSK